MRNIIAVFQKQIKDTLKNKAVFIQFLMFPIMAVIMEYSINIEGLPKHFFADMFACMYVGMAPLVSMSSVISEEKEKNTLRVLLMSNVKPAEYLTGVGSYIWMICMLGGCVLGIVGGYRGTGFFAFLAIMAVGILVSMLIGAAVGIWSKNQMSATSLTVPIMIICSFLPMLSMFNETIEKIARIVYSQQISNLINEIGRGGIRFENIGVILGNMLAATVFFVCACKKGGLE